MVRAARRVTAAEADEQQRESFCAGTGTTTTAVCTSTRSSRPRTGRSSCARSRRARDALHEQRAAEAEEPRTVPRNRLPPLSRAVPRNRLPGHPRPPPHQRRVARRDRRGGARPTAHRPRRRRAKPGPRPRRRRHPGHRRARARRCPAPAAAARSPTGPGSRPRPRGGSPATARCRRVSERDGKPLDVGRRTRSIPARCAGRSLVRDGRCQFPGCERHRFVDAHHIVHWARGGATGLDNLVLLCRHHHRWCTRGASRSPSTPTAARVLAPRRPIDPRLPAAAPLGPPPASPSADRPAAHRHGREMDLGSCVDAVLAATGAL